MNFIFYLFHFLVSPQEYLRMMLFIFVTAAALPRFFAPACVLVAGGASALVLDLLLVSGLVDFGADCAAATLHCLRFFQLNVIVLVLCVGGVLVGFSVGLESARPICHLAISSDCAIDRVCCQAGSIPCTLRTDWVIIGAVMRTLGTDGVVLSGVANDLAMAECWWMACSVSSTSCRISSAP